jgi:hypothetical protein
VAIPGVGGRKMLGEVGSRLTLNECHRNWRFCKLWLLIGLSFAAGSGFATLARLPQEGVVMTRTLLLEVLDPVGMRLTGHERVSRTGMAYCVHHFAAI